jgi:secondary thiamine-phosphate synthase enzyme
MRVFTGEVEVSTRGRGFTDVTARLEEVLRASGVQNGLLNVHIQHTSASLVISENADPDVRVDLERFMSELAPDGDQRYTHDAEGPDDMPAHVRSVLTATNQTLPVRSGGLRLGTWQAVYLWEHRRRGHNRRLDVTVIGA